MPFPRIFFSRMTTEIGKYRSMFWNNLKSIRENEANLVADSFETFPE